MLSILYWRMFMVNTYYNFNFQIIDHPSMQQYKGLTKRYNQSPIRFILAYENYSTWNSVFAFFTSSS
jgi:hypothetical protein